jgi:hypothetical protein
MESKIGIYESHEKALEAVERLIKAGHPLKSISLIGEVQIINDHLYLKSLETVKYAPIPIGALVGIMTGLLTGLGIFAIPGFGLLYGAGAIVGAMAGLDFGIIGGGLASIFVNMGIKKDKVIKYAEHIKKGRFVVIAHGTQKEIKKAEDVLRIANTQLQLH